MSKPIDLIEAAFYNGRRSIAVHGVEGLTLYFPAMTGQALDDISQDLRNRLGPKADDVRGIRNQIYQLIAMAELEDGSKAFAFEDADTLMRKMKVVEVQRLYAFMAETAYDLDAAKKGSPQTEGSASG